MQKTIILQEGSENSWSAFTKCCKEKGWCYQTLANKKLTPRIGKPVIIDGIEIKRVVVK